MAVDSHHAIWSLLLGACITSHGSSDTCGEPVHGTSLQLTTAIGAPSGPLIDSPKECDGEAYIRVHGQGTRLIEMGSVAQTQCTEPPTSPDRCVFADDFALAVDARLTAVGVETIGLGLGVCGDVAGDYAAWNVSVTVNDWKDVDAAIVAVDAELRARDIGNFFGVSVRRIECVAPAGQ